MSDELFAVLEYLVNHPQTPYKSVYHLFGEDAHLVLHLRDMKYVDIKQENPNLWYLLPEDQRQDYFIFLRPDGLEAYRLEKKVRDQQAEQEAKRLEDILRSDKNRKEQFRHDWRIAIFSAVFGFLSGTITDYFFNVVVNAVRLWEFLAALLHF